MLSKFLSHIKFYINYIKTKNLFKIYKEIKFKQLNFIFLKYVFKKIYY